MLSMLVSFRSYESKRYSWKNNRETAGKWRKSVPTTLNANPVFTNWGQPKPGNGHGYTAPVVVRDVSGVHMAKGSRLSENTKMKEGA